MSRCPHMQSTYKLRKLPHCSRCNNEFVLVTARYEGIPNVKHEWECMKCHKIIPKDSLREDPLSPEDKWLQEWCKKNSVEKREKKDYKESTCNKKVS